MAEAPNGDYSFVEFYPEGKSWDGKNCFVRCRYGPGMVETSGGGGIWEDIEHPYYPAMTVWRGPKKAYSHTIPLLLDGFADQNIDVETACDEVELMAGVGLNPEGEEFKEPPVLILDGYGALPHDYTRDPKTRWVIAEPPKWGEAEREQNTGLRVRQAFTITFMAYQQAVNARDPSLPQHSTGRFTIAKSGDTYEKIAQRIWKKKHADWGVRIAILNGAHNATTKVEAGAHVKLPSLQEERKWEAAGHRGGPPRKTIK